MCQELHWKPSAAVLLTRVATAPSLLLQHLTVVSYSYSMLWGASCKTAAALEGFPWASSCLGGACSWGKDSKPQSLAFKAIIMLQVNPSSSPYLGISSCPYLPFLPLGKAAVRPWFYFVLFTRMSKQVQALLWGPQGHLQTPCLEELYSSLVYGQCDKVRPNQKSLREQELGPWLLVPSKVVWLEDPLASQKDFLIFQGKVKKY